GGVGFVALGFTVGVGAEAGLELGEVLGREGPVLFGDARDVGAAIVDPDVLRRVAAGEVDDVGFDALAVGGEGAAGQAEDGVQVAVLAEDLEDLAGLVG